MPSIYRNLSLRGKLVVLVGALLATVVVFFGFYLPNRMESVATHWAEKRAADVAAVVAAQAAHGLEAQDPRIDNEALGLFGQVPGARYGCVRRADGAMIAAYNPEQVPEDAPPPNAKDAPVITEHGGLMRIDVPVRVRGAVLGSLTLGMTVDELFTEARDGRTAVWTACALTLLAGLVVSFLIGNMLMKPIDGIIDLSVRVAAGDTSQIRDVDVPEAVESETQDEAARMSLAFQRIAKSLRELAAAAGRVASGDLVSRLEMEGPVATAFNQMIDGQRAIVQQMGDTSVQLAASTAEIYAAAQEQQATAQQQSAGVEEASQTMQSLLQSAAHIAESARGVLANAERTKETTDAMSRRFSELTGHTNRIAELLEVIREIADRSDLLALNASLEATRAGEAGRSFSLVAAEMRRLAERVTASVQDVKALVADVRAFASSTIMAIEEARRLAESTTESARQITLVTQQQRTGTEQVSQGMRDITVALTQSVSAVGQIRTSTEELKTQADRLAEIVGNFRVDGEDAERAA